MHTETLDYTDADIVCEAFVAYNKTTGRTRPCVLIGHSWAGQTDADRQTAVARQIRQEALVEDQIVAVGQARQVCAGLVRCEERQPGIRLVGMFTTWPVLCFRMFIVSKRPQLVPADMTNERSNDSGDEPHQTGHSGSSSSISDWYSVRHGLPS